MTSKEAKKALDGIKYDPQRGTRFLLPESRKIAKQALRVLGAAGDSYAKPAQKSTKKSKPIEDSEVTNG